MKQVNVAGQLEVGWHSFVSTPCSRCLLTYKLKKNITSCWNSQRISIVYSSWSYMFISFILRDTSHLSVRLTAMCLTVDEDLSHLYKKLVCK